MKVVCLLSGGMDSAVALAIAAQNMDSVTALTFQYGQKTQVREVECARALAKTFDAEIIVTTLRPHVFSGKLVDEGATSTEVPLRNLIFLSMAGALAVKIGAEAIYTGINIVDYSDYPDCRPAFIYAAQEAMHQGGHDIKIYCPLMRMSKKDIYRQGKDLGVPFEHTHSCYYSDPECGTCPSCELKKAAMT